MNQINNVLVVGGGTAGFMAAMALKSKLPGLDVTVLRSPDIGIIGVGEGSTPPFTRFVHDFLGIHVTPFVRATMPGIKTGTCFEWGPRQKFFFPFGLHMDLKLGSLTRPVGYYFDHGDMDYGSPNSARMAANRPFELNDKRSLVVHGDYAYHVENDRFAAFLETTLSGLGVRILNGTIETADQNDSGIESVRLTDGRSMSADLYVDCTGFRSLLLGQTLGQSRTEYDRTLFCDRAVVGGWDRPAGTPMLSYTLSQTMDSGWCWRIEHPDRIHRGYVYSTAFISDAAAEAELRSKNPMIGSTRIVKFKSGRYDRTWVKNVVAIGNASGFVEPLEATSLAVIASRCQLVVELMIDCDRVVSEPVRNLFNTNTTQIWDGIRDFLSLHYRFNTRLDTPFWRHCRAETEMGDAQTVVDYYKQVGPSPGLAAAFVRPGMVFGINSYLTILSGQRVPSNSTFRPTPAEIESWARWCGHNATTAASALTAEQALAILAGGRQV